MIKFVLGFLGKGIQKFQVTILTIVPFVQAVSVQVRLGFRQTKLDGRSLGNLSKTVAASCFVLPHQRESGSPIGTGARIRKNLRQHRSV